MADVLSTPQRTSPERVSVLGPSPSRTLKPTQVPLAPLLLLST